MSGCVKIRQIDFKTKHVARGIEGYFIMMEGLIHKKGIIIVNVHLKIDPKIHEKLTEKKVDCSIIE